MHRNNEVSKNIAIAVTTTFSIVFLSACGNSADVTIDDQISGGIETEIVTVDGETSDAIEDVKQEGEADEELEVVEPVEESFDDATLIQMGENEYTFYVDCPDNSNAPELNIIPSDDSMYTLPASASNYGVSENLINAVLTHGMQVDPDNMLQINYDAYADQQFEVNIYPAGSFPFVFTKDASKYDENTTLIYTPDMLHGDDASVSISNIQLCAILLKNSIENTNGNITCALMRYNMGPEAWDQAMQECIDATGLTAEEIYANYDSSYVLQYDSLSLGDPNYVNEVLQYIGNEPITVTEIDSDGWEGITTTYNVDRNM